MTQTEAAKACGVGRRWFNELENGKETIRIGMVIDVLHHFGASLTISGEGARFTVEELENEAVMKRDGEHVWEAEFKGEYEPNAEAQPEEPQTVVRKRGQKAGYISPRTKRRRTSVKFVEKRLRKSATGVGERRRPLPRPRREKRFAARRRQKTRSPKRRTARFGLRRFYDAQEEANRAAEPLSAFFKDGCHQVDLAGIGTEIERDALPVGKCTAHLEDRGFRLTQLIAK